jgi:nicotinamide-nucleotide amidase
MILLSEKIVKKLIKKKIKISFAESCTGGMLSKTITSINGASKAFSLGVVSYSNESKINVLKVPKKIIKKYGAVSEEVCLAMVKNVSKIAKTNMSVSITGIAGPSGGTKKKPVGLVYIAVKKGNGINVSKHYFKKRGRFYIQKKTVELALKLILKILI